MPLNLATEKTLWTDAGHVHWAHRRDAKRDRGGRSAWSKIKRDTYFGADESSCPGSLYYSEELIDVFQRAVNVCPSIVMKEGILDGQPCIEGTRIPVHSVLRALEHYGSLDAAVKCYPQLTISQVKDALYFAQIVLEPADGSESSPASR